MLILKKAFAFSSAKVPKQKKNNFIEKGEKKYIRNSKNDLIL